MVAQIRKNENQSEALKLNVKDAQENLKKAPLAAVSAQVAFKKSRRPQQNDISDTTRQEAAKKGLGSQQADGGSSIYKTWKGDPLSLFMFSAAPIIMMLNFELRTTLSDAQTIETKDQVEAAFVSAAQKEAQGEAQAEQTDKDASGILAGAVGSAFQTIQGGADELIGRDVFSKEAENQGHMIDDLRSAKIVPEDQIQAGNTSDRFAEGKQLAADFERSYNAHYEEIANKRQESLGAAARDKASRSCLGMGKDDSLVELENRNLIAKAASEKAFDELTCDQRNSLKTDADYAEGFIGELGDANAVSDRLRGFNKSDRSEMLKQFAKSNKGSILRRGLSEIRELVNRKADAERAYFNNKLQTRQMFSNAISGIASGAYKMESKDAIIQAADDDAESRRQDAIASVMASAQNAQTSVISSAIEQVRALFDWYSQMESQVTSAITQHMA